MPYFLVGQPIPGLWGLLPMMHPPWAGSYEPWASPSRHFHRGWSGPASGFGHGGYYTHYDHQRSVGQLQNRGGDRQENWVAQNTKPDHLVSLNITEASRQ
jgi:hypothetical protein